MKPAPMTADTLKVLQDKPAPDRRPPCNPKGNRRFLPLQISLEDVKKALHTFPLWSSEGPDGLTPQHICDIMLGTSDDKLLNAITTLINLMLAESFNKEINEIIYSGRLIALAKKNGRSQAHCCRLWSHKICHEVHQQARHDKERWTPTDTDYCLFVVPRVAACFVHVHV